MNEDQKSGENLPMTKEQAIKNILDFIANSSAEILSLQADKAELLQLLKECDEYLSEQTFVYGKPKLLNNIAAGSVLHEKTKQLLQKHSK